MKQRITMLTLGVDDLERSLAFYRALGLKSPGIMGTEFEYGAVAFFELQPGLHLAIWPRTSIAKDTGLPLCPPAATEMMIAQNVGSPREVDDTLAEALAAGAKLVKPAGQMFWGGYACYFQDPDGHVWEIAFNPDLMPPE